MPIPFSFFDDDYVSIMCDLVLRWIQIMIRLRMQHIKNIYVFMREYSEKKKRQQNEKKMWKMLMII